jgi:acetylornithine deacetylase
MKAGLAASLMAVKLLKGMKAPLKGSLLVESVVDEEFAGGHGTLAARLRGHLADAAIVGENSGMTIYHAHRGFFLVQLTVTGSGGIDFNVGASALANPVEHVGRLIEWINEYRYVRRERAAVPESYRDLPEPSPVLLTQVSSGDLGPTHPIAVPSRCTLEVYIQTMPGETREGIEKEFFGFLDSLCRKDPYFSKHPLERHFPYRWIPGSFIPADHPLVTCARSAAGTVLGREVSARAAPYPCDLYIFNDLFHIPGILLGPRGDNAHAPDEYVLVDDLIDVTRIYMLTALAWCNGI